MRTDVWAVIGGGASGTVEEIEKLRGRVRVLCINDAYRLAPWADAVYAADIAWWAQHYQKVRECFAGRMYTCTNSADTAKLYHAYTLYGCWVFGQEPKHNLKHDGLSNDRRVLRMGGISGYQSIGVVKHWGAKVIMLYKFDMCRTGGLLHWFGDHPKPLRNGTDFSKYLKRFATIKPEDYGIEIVNCTVNTALTCFPQMTIDEALARHAPN